jgi:hypothetical protein
MKIELNMVLDLPSGEIDGFSDAEIRQMLFDNIQNRLECSYRMAVLRSAADRIDPTPSPESRLSMLQIYKTWADIIHTATWNYRKVPDGD